MIQEEFKVEKREKADYPPLPKDVYQVELLDITDEKKPTYKTRNMSDDQKVYETVLSFQFTILEGRDESQEKDEHKNLRCRNIWENFVPNYLYVGKNGKNKLYKIVEAFLGREITPEDEATLDSNALNSFVGSQLRVTTGHRSGKDNAVYDEITEYLKANGKLPQLTTEEIDKCRVKKDKDEEVATEDNSKPTMSTEEANEVLNTLDKTI